MDKDTQKNIHIHYIEKCIEISSRSLKKKDYPFGSIIVKNEKIISKSENNAKNKVSDHAEIIALHKAAKKMKSTDLTGCTLYTNCEPCPMCSFMIREYKISRVVFAARSNYVGGYSKWKILQDKSLQKLEPFFAKPPEIIPYVLEDKATVVFRAAGFWMMGNQK